MLKDDYSGTTWKQYLAQFNKMYPNIKISIEGGTDYANSALTRLQGGDWGDIMMIPAVDKSELGNYFLSYGSLDDVKKEVKYVPTRPTTTRSTASLPPATPPASSTTRRSSRTPASTSCRPPRMSSSPT